MDYEDGDPCFDCAHGDDGCSDDPVTLCKGKVPLPRAHFAPQEESAKGEELTDNRSMSHRLYMLRRRAETTRDRIQAKESCAPGEMDDLLLAEEVMQYLAALRSRQSQSEPGQDVKEPPYFPYITNSEAAARNIDAPSYNCALDDVRDCLSLPADAALRGVLAEVAAERVRQDAKWGVQNHKPPEWLSILGEEFGEVCRAVCERLYAIGLNPEYRLELIQTAAVAVAMVECYDRAALASSPREDGKEEG